MSSLTNANPLLSSGPLDDFQPRSKTSVASAQTEIGKAEKVAVRQAAHEMGYVIDNLSAVVRAKRQSSGKASKSHTLRLYIQDINRFQTWCNDNNYSQARGFELLLDKVL